MNQKNPKTVYWVEGFETEALGGGWISASVVRCDYGVTEDTRVHSCDFTEMEAHGVELE